MPYPYKIPHNKLSAAGRSLRFGFSRWWLDNTPLSRTLEDLLDIA